MPVLWAIFAIYTVDPFFTWKTYPYNAYFNLIGNVIKICLIIYLMVLGITKKHIKNQLATVGIIYLFAIQFLYRSFDTVDGSIQMSIGTLITAILCIGFLMMNDNERASIFLAFVITFSVTLVPGIFVNICKMIHINLPYSILESAEIIKTNSNLHYKQTFFSVILENPWWPDGYRKLCGIYDEPGRVGTIAGMLLPALPFNSQKKIERFASYVIVVGGFMSMSLAYYVLLICYILIKFMENKKFTAKQLLYGGIAIFTGGEIFGYLSLHSESFQKQIISRFSIANIITNNNRVSDAFDIIYKNFLNNSEKWFGVGSGNTVIQTVDAAGYQIIVYTYGIVGFSLIFLWVCAMGVYFSKKNKNALLVTLFFLLSFYQRGWIFPFYHMVILCGGISYILIEAKKKVVRKI